MRVFLTGCEGFIGREVERRLRDEGIELVGVDVAASGAAGHKTCDIRSLELEDALPRGTDAVVHLAALSRDEDCRRDPAAAFDVNVGGTLNVVRAAEARGVPQVVFASSEWVYGEVSNHGVQTEDASIDVGRLTSVYGLTKIVGESLLAMASRRGSFVGTVLRFGIVYGPRPSNWSAVESLSHAVRTRDRVEVKGSLASARRFVHVSDIAEGILRALGRGEYEVFNLAGERLITLGQIIETSAELLGRAPVVVEGDPRAVSVRNPDSSKACEVLGWRPKVDLRDGLRTLWSEL